MLLVKTSCRAAEASLGAALLVYILLISPTYNFNQRLRLRCLSLLFWPLKWARASVPDLVLFSTEMHSHDIFFSSSIHLHLSTCSSAAFSSSPQVGFSSSAMAGVVAIATESPEWSERKRVKGGKEKGGEQGKRKRDGRGSRRGKESLRVKVTLHPSLPHRVCLSFFLHLFSFFSPPPPSHRLVS